MAALADRLDLVIGAKSAKPLEDHFGIRTVNDLLRHYPRKYSDGMTVRDLGDALRALVAVELRAAQPGGVDDLHHPGGGLVAEDADREDLRREPPGDVGRVDRVEDVLEHGEVLIVGTRAPEELEVLGRAGAERLIIDLVRLPDADQRRGTPNYQGIGW